MAFAAAVLALCPSQRVHAAAATVPTGFVDQQMAGSLSEPVGISGVPDASARPPRVLFVEQRTARVGVIVGPNVYTVGTVPGVASVENERGLLGIAVDPGWPGRPYLYVHCTDGRSGHHIAVSRFTVTGDLGYTDTGALQFDPATRYDLLNSLPDDAVNHNGGTVRFGPDGRLYVSIGDDARGCPALLANQLLGKILRLDVSRLPATGAGPPPLALLIPPDNPFIAMPDSVAKIVWTVGLRNPFRFHIDPVTSALFISDVGQDTWEEMDRVPSGGMNMGWPQFEGNAAYMACSPPGPVNPTAPISVYNHSEGVVIISGGCYRNPSTASSVRFGAAYDGSCFYLDYATGFMRRLTGSGTSWTVAPMVAGQPSASDWGEGFDTVSDMLEMNDGSLWYCRQFDNGPGEIRRIIHPSATGVPLAAATALSLAKPWPSPSDGAVTLSWYQPAAAPIRIAIYDLGGREVRVIEDGATIAAGRHEAAWDGRDPSGRAAGPGLYFVRLLSEGLVRQERFTLLR